MKNPCFRIHFRRKSKDKSADSFAFSDFLRFSRYAIDSSYKAEGVCNDLSLSMIFCADLLLHFIHYDCRRKTKDVQLQGTCTKPTTTSHRGGGAHQTHHHNPRGGREIQRNHGGRGGVVGGGERLIIYVHLSLSSLFCSS